MRLSAALLAIESKKVAYTLISRQGLSQDPVKNGIYGRSKHGEVSG